MKTKISKLVAIVLLFAITNIQSFSQSINLDEMSGCLVSDVSGKVTYTEPGNPTPKPVTVGMVLSDDANLSIRKKSSITLVNEDHSLMVNKKGNHQMANLAVEVKEKGEVSRFAKMAFAAKGYGTDTSKQRTIDPPKGWGGEDSILFENPIGKKIIKKPTTFKWTVLKEGSKYKFIIFEKSKDLPLMVVNTSNNFLEVDIPQLEIKTGTTYYAQVMLESDIKVNSELLSLTFVEQKDVASSLAVLQNENEYKMGTQVKKLLMEASELESHGFYDLAGEWYQKAIKLNKKDTLAMQLYSAFLSRINKE
jgi:hypothetical protein